MSDTDAKRMSLIVTKGTLDGAYPPFILATTAAAMGVQVSMFFTFHGLSLLKKDLELEVSPFGEADMAMRMLSGQASSETLAMLPGASAASTALMKDLLAKKGIASIADLREAAVDSDVEIIACQMTIELFEYKKADLIDGITFAGAATYLERALGADINLYI